MQDINSANNQVIDIIVPIARTNITTAFAESQLQVVAGDHFTVQLFTTNFGPSYGIDSGFQFTIPVALSYVSVSALLISTSSTPPVEFVNATCGNVNASTLMCSVPKFVLATIAVNITLLTHGIFLPTCRFIELICIT